MVLRFLHPWRSSRRKLAKLAKLAPERLKRPYFTAGSCAFELRQGGWRSWVKLGEAGEVGRRAVDGPSWPGSTDPKKPAPPFPPAAGRTHIPVREGGAPFVIRRIGGLEEPDRPTRTTPTGSIFSIECQVSRPTLPRRCAASARGFSFVPVLKWKQTVSFCDTAIGPT